MPPQWVNQPGGIDCIDLTSDSPPPPPRHRPQQSTSSRPHPAFRHSSSSRHARTRSRDATPSRNRVPTPSTRNQGVHPEQLRRIITTSDPHVLQAVLLDLCRLSPALSGAIARGLASHSTYTRNIINRIKEPKILPKAGPSPGTLPGFGESSRAPITVKKEPVLSHAPRAEIQVLTDSEDSDSEDLGSFNNRTSTVQPTLTAFAERSKPTASQAGPSRQQGMPVRPRQKCIRCRHPYNTYGICEYHPGGGTFINTPNGDLVKVYNCCKLPIGEPGCRIGDTHLLYPEMNHDLSDGLEDYSDDDSLDYPFEKRPRFR